MLSSYEDVNVIMDSLPNLIYVIDNEGKIIYINKSAKNIMREDGIPIDLNNYSELMRIYQVSDESGIVDLRNMILENRLNNGTQKSSILKWSKDDRVRFIKTVITPLINNGYANCHVISGEDVTENYLMEEQLKKERENFITISTELKTKCDIIEILRNREKEHLMHLKDVINNISEGILVLDNKGKFNFCNRSVYSIININPSDLIYYGNIGVKYKIKDLSGRAIKIEEVFNSNTSVKNLILSFVDEKNEIEKYIEFNVNPIFNKTKELLYTIISLKDVTSSVKHNIELEKITMMKDEFFAVMSHELRTPLTLIHSSLQLAYGVYEQEISSNIDRTLSRINQNCSRLLKLINNILDITKAEAGFLTVVSTNFEIVSTTEMIVSSVNNFALSRDIELVFDTNEEEMYVNLDKDKYEKILLNLLSNAIKFTPEGKEILVTLNIDKENIYLTVKDEGVGIPEDKLESIFDRFAQVNSSLSRRAEGTGLGLSLVKKLVEMMGGTIYVNSTINVGSEFVIRFGKFEITEKFVDNYSMVDVNISDKINIEFSDIN
jgi:two-component system phosphate regulon sensor histidine kinase PhoR